MNGDVVIPDTLPILPLPRAAVFPFEIVPLGLRSDGALRLIDDAMRKNRMVGLFAQGSDGGELPPVGTAAIVHRLQREEDGSMRLLLQGLERVRLVQRTSESPYLVARVAVSPEVVDGGAVLDALARTAVELFGALASEMPPPVRALLGQMASDPRQLVYVVAANLPLAEADRQVIVELDPIGAKLRRLIDVLQHERSVGELRAQIEERTREQLTRQQREVLLREQLRAIQNELGDLGGRGGELRARVAEARLPPEAQAETERELLRLEQLPEASPEHGIIRSYIEWMVALPWSNGSPEAIDLARARAVLDEDHYDVELVKQRILEHLAVKKLREERGAGEGGEPILCFVGPPGVGKTSLGQSIARAMRREFGRVSLGGVHDEAEIRGHRRTYIGAMPGRFIQALRRAGVGDPVFMLDEIDKLGSGFQGDPAAALLEVLDPAQNKAFVDNYLGVPFDLSRVFFICTANATDPVPAALLDRVEVVPLAGYTEEEKLHIARRHLLPKLVAAHGLRPGEVELTDETLRCAIGSYTREAGVRGLERVLAQMLRRLARRVAEGAATPLRADAGDVEELLGRPRFDHSEAERIDRPGIARGLAWTPVGGEVLYVEAMVAPSRRERLILTGMLGDVMRESAMAALSYVGAHASQLGAPPHAIEGKTVHVHVPSGAIPKDGPSAGVTMLAALASLATDRPVRDDVAMTGEITLRGKVLPVGGIKEKVLAAYRAGVPTAILPHGNERDLEDLPEEIRCKMRFVLACSAEDVLAEALQHRS